MKERKVYSPVEITPYPNVFSRCADQLHRNINGKVLEDIIEDDKNSEVWKEVGRGIVRREMESPKKPS